VWDSTLISHVVAALGLPDRSQDRPASLLAGYPHIAVIATTTGPLVVKRIAASPARASWFNDLYNTLAARHWAATPCRTRAGTHIIACGDFVVIALDWLPAPMLRPTPRWWAATLAELHSLHWTTPGTRTLNVIDHRAAGPAADLVDTAHHVLPTDVRASLLRPLDECPAVHPMDDLTEVVVSHGDPNTSNVRGVAMKLLDFDRSGFAFREYDLQRLLWFRATEQPHDARVLLAFWDEFTQVYQERSGYKIQDDRLRALYNIDVAKAAAWLALVATDPTRTDRERQARTLTRLLEVLRHRSVDKILRK
jgi:Ser/Thr protein kinase RdoA (MazF antagonist)